MADNNVQNALESLLSNFKGMVDANSVIGTPITTPDGTTIIPISKIHYGFATGSGNTNIATKGNINGFGAGGGGGVTVTPVAFLTVSNGVVKVIQVEPFVSTVDRMIDKMPDMMDKVGGFIDDKREAHAIKKEEKKAEKELKKAEKAAEKELKKQEKLNAHND